MGHMPIIPSRIASHCFKLLLSSSDFQLDNVDCTGDEASIDQCSHDGWGHHNCTEEHVIGVRCGVSEDSSK